MASKEWMIPYTRSLAAAGFVVLAIDQAGHGASTGWLSFDALRDDGLAAFHHLKTHSAVDPNNIGILGWSMGASTVWLSTKLLTPADNLKSVVIVGAALTFVFLTTTRSLFAQIYSYFRNSTVTFPNENWPPNVLFALGHLDELISDNDVKVALGSMTVLPPNETVQEETLYGNYSLGTARKLAMGFSDHAFEAIDHILITNTIEWFTNTLHPPTTSTPCTIHPVSMGGLEFVGWTAGLTFFFLLLLGLSIPLNKPLDKHSEEVLSLPSAARTGSTILIFAYQAPYYFFWWIIQGVIWLILFGLGVIFMHLKIGVLFLPILLGTFLFGEIIYGIYYWRLCRPNFTFRQAILEPWIDFELKSFFWALGGFLLFWIGTRRRYCFDKHAIDIASSSSAGHLVQCALAIWPRRSSLQICQTT